MNHAALPIASQTVGGGGVHDLQRAEYTPWRWLISHMGKRF